ncbi:thiamine pyrophosphate-binding protein [Mycolicibacterium sp.]|uniref:thiamine pyrophosphate-binding protein n=2 Tax=Mycolicibacterium sp. TaxID=2320850 RepID=UPI003D0DD478
MTDLSGAAMLVDYLVKEEVPYAFGVCGHGILGLLDALYDRRESIRTITTQDEQAAGFMADAYYRVTHRPAVTYTSCGPGSLNLTMAVANAFYDSSAFMAITGNVPTSQFNRGPFQETGRHFQGDFNNVMRPFVKRTYQAPRPEMIPLIVSQAYSRMVSGRPGPVHIDVPLDVFVETADVAVPDPIVLRGGISWRSSGEPSSVRRAAELLLGAQRPLVLAGNGVALSEATQELRDLVELLNVPVITSPLGKGLIDERSPLSLGATGRNGPYAANEASRQCDVILAIGTRFDDRPTSSWIPGMTYNMPPTQLIQVDIDPDEMGRNYPPAVGIIGDAKLVLRQLIAELRDGADEARTRHDDWVEQTAVWKHKWAEALAPDQRSDAIPVRPERLVDDLGAVLPDNSIILADVGVHHNWLVQQLEIGPRAQFLQAWGYAAMGFGVAGAIGAQFAAPDRPVVAVCGDGGFLMTANAVATAVMYDLPVTWVVWNNNGYGSIKGQQAGFFGADREIATRFRKHGDGELISSDFAMLARSMGADGVVVERPADLAEQLRCAISSDRPTVVEVRVDAEVSPLATGSWSLPPLPGPPPNWSPA